MILHRDETTSTVVGPQKEEVHSPSVALEISHSRLEQNEGKSTLPDMW